MCAYIDHEQVILWVKWFIKCKIQNMYLLENMFLMRKSLVLYIVNKTTWVCNSFNEYFILVQIHFLKREKQ